MVFSAGQRGSAANWEFVGLAAQPPSPPALVRGGDTRAHTGIGGSPSTANFSKKDKELGRQAKNILFDALLPGIRTPPATSLRTGGTPLINAGGKASNHPHTLTARQIPIYCATKRYRAGQGENDHRPRSSRLVCRRCRPGKLPIVHRGIFCYNIEKSFLYGCGSM